MLIMSIIWSSAKIDKVVIIISSSDKNQTKETTNQQAQRLSLVICPRLHKSFFCLPYTIAIVPEYIVQMK
jgi:hypothetical protein